MDWPGFYKFVNKFGIDGLLSKKKGGNNKPVMEKDEAVKFFQELKGDSEKGLVITAITILSKLLAKIKKAFLNPRRTKKSKNNLKRHIR